MEELLENFLRDLGIQDLSLEIKEKFSEILEKIIKRYDPKNHSRSSSQYSKVIKSLNELKNNQITHKEFEKIISELNSKIREGGRSTEDTLKNTEDSKSDNIEALLYFCLLALKLSEIGQKEKILEIIDITKKTTGEEKFEHSSKIGEEKQERLSSFNLHQLFPQPLGKSESCSRYIPNNIEDREEYSESFYPYALNSFSNCIPFGTKHN